jgi:hypothetical protein
MAAGPDCLLISNNDLSVQIPWQLDRIDQASDVLDGKYTATSDATGVNIYLLSSVRNPLIDRCCWRAHKHFFSVFRWAWELPAGVC